MHRCGAWWRLQVFAPDEKIDTINDQYWQVRAEAIPQEEVDHPQSTRRIHVYHVIPGATNNVRARPLLGLAALPQAPNARMPFVTKFTLGVAD